MNQWSIGWFGWSKTKLTERSCHFTTCKSNLRSRHRITVRQVLQSLANLIDCLTQTLGLFPLGSNMSANYSSPVEEITHSQQGVNVYKVFLHMISHAATGLVLYCAFPSRDVWNPKKWFQPRPSHEYECTFFILSLPLFLLGSTSKVGLAMCFLT